MNNNWFNNVFLRCKRFQPICPAFYHYIFRVILLSLDSELWYFLQNGLFVIRAFPSYFSIESFQNIAVLVAISVMALKSNPFIYLVFAVVIVCIVMNAFHI